MLTSKERMTLALEHKEADRVPCGEIEINSKFASIVINRYAYTGVGGSIL